MGTTAYSRGGREARLSKFPFQTFFSFVKNLDSCVFWWSKAFKDTIYMRTFAVPDFVAEFYSATWNKTLVIRKINHFKDFFLFLTQLEERLVARRSDILTNEKWNITTAWSEINKKLWLRFLSEDIERKRSQLGQRKPVRPMYASEHVYQVFLCYMGLEPWQGQFWRKLF